MNDLFQSPDQVETEETLKVSLVNKWKEKYPTAPPEFWEDKANSDLYIKTLERQKDELRTDFMKAQEEIQKGKALEQLIDRLNVKEPPVAPQPAKENTPPASLHLDDVKKWYEDEKRLEKENHNFTKVQAKLQERFGNKAGEFLSEQASTLVLSKEEINALARKSPEAFFRIMGLEEKSQDLFNAPPRSSYRNETFMPKPTKRTWTYYQDLKLKNPTEYWKPTTQLQMHKDSESLGPAFEDGDFSR